MRKKLECRPYQTIKEEKRNRRPKQHSKFIYDIPIFNLLNMKPYHHELNRNYPALANDTPGPAREGHPDPINPPPSPSSTNPPPPFPSSTSP